MKQARLPLVLVLIVALLITGITRRWAEARHGKDVAVAATGSSLGRMDSYALALLLGGLRGPLVMFLWSTSETQKSADDLEDFDTKVEWIRLLQPEFDSVHIFQIWNKAYNISVKMTSLANKYTTIIDALDYADRVDRERPDNINIIAAKAGVYFDKLGNSAEKSYYRERVRRETAYRENAAGARTGRRLELDSLVGPDQQIRPEFLNPRSVTLRGDDGLVYDGSELQFLPRYAPFPYGVPPLAMGYNYYARAQVLQRVGHQRHTQLSEQVIDSRPALSLKFWAEDEWDIGRRAEIDAFGLPQPPANAERWAMEKDTMTLSPATPLINRAAAERAIYSYDLAQRLGVDAIAAYDFHLKEYPNNALLYSQHRDALQALIHQMSADRDYLKAMLLPGDQRQELLASARNHYRESLRLNQYQMIRYCLTDRAAETLLPPGITKANLLEHPDLIPGLALKSMQIILQNAQEMDFSEDFQELSFYIARAEQRLQLIGE